MLFRRICLLVVIFFEVLLISSFAQTTQTETMEIVTYYPAPYGVYKNLRLYPNNDFAPGAACSDEGTLNYDLSDHRLYVCSGAPLLWTEVGSTPTLDYSTCSRIMVGCDDGAHTTYCPPGYITVGGETDGNDYIPESQVCCRLSGIKTINWGARPVWGHLHDHPCPG